MTPIPGLFSDVSSVNFLVKTAGNGDAVQDFIIPENPQHCQQDQTTEGLRQFKPILSIS